MEYHLEEAIRKLSKGTFLFKIRCMNCFYRRKYFICMKGKYISYDGSRKLCCNRAPFRLNFDGIEDVRRGWKTDMFNVIEAQARAQDEKNFKMKNIPKMEESLCFSIILKDYSSIDLVAETEQILLYWIQVLSFIVASNKNAEKNREKEQFLKDQFKKADVNSSGSLDFQECIKLLRQLNISMNRLQAKFLFNRANNSSDVSDGNTTHLSIDEFLYFYHSLIKRQDIEIIFRRYSGTSLDVMGPEDLMRFLNEEQKVNATVEDCKSIIDRVEPDNEILRGYLSLKGFQEYILSSEFDIFNKKHMDVYEDMTQSLSHYFIASSHNTYLMSDQLVGSSSVEGYIRALLKSCRCVELDCWDGSDGEPIIYHGHTFTSKILVRDVLDAIKVYAFKTSKYPVILSFENHCSLEYQRTIASHLSRIFGDQLYTKPITDDMVALPSPEDLLNKIIIKAKKTSSDVDEADNLDENSISSEDSRDRSASPDSSSVTIKQFIQSTKNACNKISSSMDVSKEPEVNEELSNLVNICQSFKFKSFKNHKAHGKFHYISSLAESKALSLIKRSQNDFIIHHQTFLSRIYPSGVRTDSSNYDPIPMWNSGCQVVALNYQTQGKSLRLNDSMFTANGFCGYRLKPAYMRDGNIADHDSYLKKNRKILHIKIISGHHIPKPNQANDGEIIDPYIKLVIRGKNIDDKEECKTNYVKNNGFNPVWNEEFELNVKYPETSNLEFFVKDNSTTGTNEFLGGYVLPFTSIMEGYRNVTLNDANGNRIPMAVIFVHIKIFNQSDIN